MKFEQDDRTPLNPLDIQTFDRAFKAQEPVVLTVGGRSYRCVMDALEYAEGHSWSPTAARIKFGALVEVLQSPEREQGG